METALAEAGARLVLARLDSSVMGCAVLIPRVAAAELRYLAVDPEGWSQGIAQALLNFIQQHAERLTVDLELWVIADNYRAVRAYERAGWAATSDMRLRDELGRPERRFILSQ
jgi:GNAT superfamily N-acetyltransferase